MIATQEILFGTSGQELVLEIDRPIASVTSVEAWELTSGDDSATEDATTGSASVDSATEATTAAISQSDRRLISVASTAGFVAGRRCLLTGGGYSEPVEIEAIGSGAIYTRHPIRGDFPSGSTLSGSVRATIAVSTSWASDKANISPAINPNPRYRVSWTVVHADVTETAVYERNFDLVRRGAIPKVSPIDVDNAHPGWLDALPPDHQRGRGRDLIAEATSLVRFDLYHRGISDQALRNVEAFSRLVIDRAVYLAIDNAVMSGAQIDTSRMDAAQKRYDRSLASIVDSPVLALDRTGSGGADTIAARPPLPLWVRT